MAGALSYGDEAAREVSRRIIGSFVSTTALKALTPERRAARGLAVVQPDDGSPDIWSFDEQSTASGDANTLVPDDAPAAGRWVRMTATAAELEDGAVSLAKLGFSLSDSDVTAVVLDHADSSPKTLLAANANVDRIVRLRAVATEAAAGAPDLDVGITGDTTSVVEDYKAGAWVVGDAFESLFLLPAGADVLATIAAAGTAGAFNVYLEAVVIPKPVTELVAGQDETSDTTIPVTGLTANDELIEVLVFTPGGPSFAARALADFTLGAGVLNVVANAANNTGNQYHVRWRDKT